MANKTVVRIIVCLLIFAIVGCGKKFDELDGLSFKKKWEESGQHSAVSWWYLGEKDNYFYIVEKWISEEYNYKVDKKYIEVVLDQPKEFILDEDQWLNLKTRHIKFKD